MDAWLVWLLPVGLFWPIAAIYLGGLFDLRGGKPVMELVGLVLSFLLTVAVWWALGKALGSIGPILGAIVLPTLLTLAILPLILVLGYRVIGIRVVRGVAH